MARRPEGGEGQAGLRNFRKNPSRWLPVRAEVPGSRGPRWTGARLGERSRAAPATAPQTLRPDGSLASRSGLVITHNVPAVVNFLLSIFFMSVLMGSQGEVHRAESEDG